MTKPPYKHAADPNAKQEAQKYDNPVPSREYIISELNELARPMTHMQLCAHLNIEDPEQIEGLRFRLFAMCRDGQLSSNRKDAFIPIDQNNIVEGVIQGHRDGYGFVLQEGDDVYISNRQMKKVFHGDKVTVQIMGKDRKGRPEGKILKVQERNTQYIVGRFFEGAGVGNVIPDNKRVSQEILVPAEHKNGAQHSQFVTVEIIEQPRPNHMPVGKVVEVLGEHLAPGMEIDVAVRSHDIPHTWPEELLSEVEKLPEEVVEKDKKKRIDLRHLPFVTIDGEDARDFDDAVYCEKNTRTEGWRLYVAIADVSHYVNIGTELDKEAHKRATSVYFPEHVIPMLPEKLSNGLCSLNPEVDRLVMVCEMTISKTGKLSGYKFYEGLIHSHARLTYNKVWDMLNKPLNDEGKKSFTESGKEWRKVYRPVVKDLEEIYRLYKVLRKNRDKRGAIDFETTETRIIFDSERKIQQIVPVERNEAHMLIEECMLSANVCAADFLDRYSLPALYRVHKGPSDEKLNNLNAFLGELGLSMNASAEPSPQQYQQLLSQIKERADAHLIQTVMLRSLSQAVYQPENEGHFGLAYEAYAHFTSPIRRYPDLLVHRAIRSIIRSTRECAHIKRADGAGRIPKKNILPYDTAAMMALGEHCSMAERRADDATRDVMDFLKCEYMQQHVGEVYQGTISAVTGFGLFVELNDIYAEGLIHISNLNNDFYQFDATKHRLIGERTRRVFRLGDQLWIQVMRVDLEERKVDFELATAPSRKDQKQVFDNSQSKTQIKQVRKRPAHKKFQNPDDESSNESGHKKKSFDKKKSNSKNSNGSEAKKGKRKPSKRQKLNAAKNSASKANSKGTGKKKALKKAGKKTVNKAKK